MRHIMGSSTEAMEPHKSQKAQMSHVQKPEDLPMAAIARTLLWFTYRPPKRPGHQRQLMFVLERRGVHFVQVEGQRGNGTVYQALSLHGSLALRSSLPVGWRGGISWVKNESRTLLLTRSALLWCLCPSRGSLCCSPRHGGCVAPHKPKPAAAETLGNRETFKQTPPKMHTQSTCQADGG